MTNARQAKAIRLGKSLVVVLPKDWTRGQKIGPGDTLDVIYNGIVKFSVPSRREKDGEEHED